MSFEEAEDEMLPEPIEVDVAGSGQRFARNETGWRCRSIGWRPARGDGDRWRPRAPHRPAAHLGSPVHPSRR